MLIIEEVECWVYGDSVVTSQLFCKYETILKENIYLNNEVPLTLQPYPLWFHSSRLCFNATACRHWLLLIKWCLFFHLIQRWIMLFIGCLDRCKTQRNQWCRSQGKIPIIANVRGHAKVRIHNLPWGNRLHS